MKNLIFYGAIPFLAFLFWGCSSGNDNYIGQFDGVVIDGTENQNKFKQITFTLDVAGEYGYLNTHRIDSIRLNVNGRQWGIFPSESIDTIGNTDVVAADLKFSRLPISYLVVAPYLLSTDNLQTAGDFVEYLHNRLVLTPGEYVCEVAEIKFKNVQDEWISLKPHVFRKFTVVQNTTSSYAGDIHITLKK